MSYSREAVEQKLERLDESQASIVATSEWFLFHYRNAKESVSIWSDAMRKSPRKRLALFYLANEVIQQSRKHRRTEYLMYFSEFLPPVLGDVFAELSPKDQARFRKVIGVWKERAIFSERIFTNFYQAIDGVSESASSVVDKALSKVQRDQTPDDDPDIAPELAPVSVLYNKLSTKNSSNTAQLVKHKKLYDSLFHSEHLPAPAKYIQQLEALEKLNVSCSDNSLEIIKVRKDIVAALERLVEAQNHWIKTEESKLEILQTQLKDTKLKHDELKDFVDEDMEVAADEAPQYAEDSDDDEAPKYAEDSDDASDAEADGKRKNEEEPEPVKRPKLEEDAPELVTQGSVTPEPEEAYDPGVDEVQEPEQAPEEMNTDLANLLSMLT